jgi:signal peptidase I
MPFENHGTGGGDSDSGFDYERFILEEEAADQNKKPEKKTKPESPSDLYEWMQSLVSALLICVIAFAFFVRNIGIIGSSMEPTFSDGDRVVLSNLFYTPAQGDVVVLRKLSFQKEPIIKRVIAVAGQTVDIDFEQGVVYVDDQPLPESYTADPTHVPIDFDGKITVPENCIFVMGDNRNASLDSRSNLIGCVDERYVIGKVLLRFLPIDKFGAV